MTTLKVRDVLVCTQIECCALFCCCANAKLGVTQATHHQQSGVMSVCVATVTTDASFCCSLSYHLNIIITTPSY